MLSEPAKSLCFTVSASPAAIKMIAKTYRIIWAVEEMES